jgi:hypothetical protein
MSKIDGRAQPTPTYPTDRKHQRFFALKFLRLLVKTAAAQSIGTEGCWLLAIVVNTEDKTRYRRPVSFFNEQLMALLGFSRWHRLDAVRKATIEAGWLNYEPPPNGVRGRAGTYWVTIPEYAEDLPDDSVDEGPASTESGDGRRPPSTGASTENGDGRSYGGVDACVEPPIPDPDPDLIPSLSQGCDEPAGKKVRIEYPEAFEEFWKSYPSRDGRRNGKAKSLALWKQISAEDRPLVQAAAERFALSRLAADNKARDPERFLAKDWWRDWLVPEADGPAQSSRYEILGPRRRNLNGRATA